MTVSRERPMIFLLFNPISHVEAMPTDILAWSNGRALGVTSSPVASVE
ncbi:malic enzyme-like NAD(P)-binding protein [Mycobacterium lepromatosis]